MQDLNSAHGFISAQTTAAALTTATAAVTEIDNVITSVNSQRATFGAKINQLTYAVDNLSNVKVNSEAARSRILDTDYARETSELARTQIIQQAGTAMLAQANQFLRRFFLCFSSSTDSGVFKKRPGRFFVGLSLKIFSMLGPIF